MSLDHHARLERLLTRHGDATAGRGPSGQTALHRRDQLLVPAEHAERAATAAGQWLERSEPLHDIGAAVLHLRPELNVDLSHVVDQLRSHPDGPIPASANHLLRGTPEYDGGPYDAPTPCGPLEAPKPLGAERRVITAILDTGVVAHPWFENAPWFADVAEDQIDPLAQAPDYELETQAGHGTFVAGVLMREAPDAYLMIERVLGDDGVCDEVELLRGLRRLRTRLSENGWTVDVVNLSLGGYSLDDEPSPLVAAALAEFGNGTVVVAAAGNSTSTRPFWPAALKHCVAVGALGPDCDEGASFSNRGWWVDASAAGEQIHGPFASGFEANGHEFHGYASWSGTSFSAPKVAGEIARLAGTKNMSAAAAADSLLDRSSRVHRHNFGVVVR